MGGDRTYGEGNATYGRRKGTTMKLKWLVAALFTVLLLTVTAVVALAQEEPPAPYAGLKNPFAWSDAQAQAAGRKLYEQSCLGCHGASGSSLKGFDFSAPRYS